MSSNLLSARSFKTSVENSVDPVCMPKLVLDESIYMQQMTSVDDIFRCVFFVAGEVLIFLAVIIYIISLFHSHLS